VGLFLDRAWAHFASREYASTSEILLHHLRRDDPAARSETSWRARMFRAFDGVWRRLFFDSPVPRERQLLLEHYTIAVLSGLAATLLLEGPRARLRAGELTLLRETLVRELRG
jgi:hypothetical protein